MLGWLYMYLFVFVCGVDVCPCVCAVGCLLTWVFDCLYICLLVSLFEFPYMVMSVFV